MKAYLILMVLLISTVAGQTYNTTALDDATNPYEYTVAINSAMDYSVGLAILLVVTIISFTVGMASDGNPFSGMGAAGFFSGLSATILLPLQLIDSYTYQWVIIADAVFLTVIFLFGRK